MTSDNDIRATGRPGDEAALDALFAEARTSRLGELPDGLFSRILADAEQEMPKMDPAPVARKATVKGGWLAGILDGIGGWKSVSGLATATVAGVWLGFSGDTATGAIESYWSGGTEAAATVELLPGAESFFVADASEG